MIPNALITTFPVEISPPQREAFINAIICALDAVSVGAISITFVVLKILLLLMVYEYGAEDPLQPLVLKVTSISLLVTSISLLFCIRVGLKPYHQRPRTRCAAINSKIQSVTLSASSWTGSEAPFTYVISLSSVGLTGNSQIDIGPGVASTNEQYKALLAASLCGGSISGNNLTIRAWGQKPTINIPITITVREG